MKYPYIVVRDGVWYPAGADVPAGNELDNDNSDEQTKTYTKTEINRMQVAELQELANEQGIENSNEMTGTELKKVLIETFNL